MSAARGRAASVLSCQTDDAPAGLIASDCGEIEAGHAERSCGRGGSRERDQLGSWLGEFTAAAQL
jgi:hypothetical protein